MLPFVTHTEDEKLVYTDRNSDTTIFKPHYSTADAYDYFEKIINNFLNDENSSNRIYIKGYNLISTIFEDLYWNYCFQYVKYKKFIDRYGVIHTIKKENKGWQINGLERVQNFLHGINQYSFTGNIINKYKFINWVLRIYLYNTIKKNFIVFKVVQFFFKYLKNRTLNPQIKKIWVEHYLINNFRFDLLSDMINQDELLIINKLTTLKRKPAKTINNAIIYEVWRKNNNYRWWLFAIRILKPERIIVNDNLYDDYSLLLAAKIAGIEIIGVSHGMVSKYHRGQFGSKYINGEKLIKFDRFYVWDKEFKKLLEKEGFIYQKDKIKICGFLHKTKYTEVTKKKKNDLVLYPFEHFADYASMLKLLKWFEKREFKILIKSRPDMENYGHFPGLNFELVDDFTKNHFENALCIVGSTTTMLFDLSITGLPIVLPKNNGVNILSDISLPNWVYFDKNFSIQKISNFYPVYNLSSVTENFLSEFKQ